MKYKKPLVICCLGMLLIMLGIFLNCCEIKITSVSNELFILKNQSKKYALFNENGKQLSDYLYDEEFFEYKNLLVLQNKEEGAIFNRQGKQLYSGKDIGSYRVMNSFYFNRLEKDSYLYNYLGKKVKIYDPKKFEIVLFSDNYILLKNDKQVKLLTEDENLINVFENEPIDKNIRLLESGKLIVIKNNNTNYFVDAENKTLVHKINNPKSPILFEKYDNLYLYGFSNLEETTYYFYKNDEKLYEINGKSCSLNKNNNKFICVSSNENQSGIILSEKGEAYALQNSDFTVSIFYNSKLAKIVAGSLGSKTNYNGIYTIVHEDKESKKYSFYNIEAKEILLNKNYDYADSFNLCDNLIVAQKDKYFIINKEGKKISNEYLNLTSYEMEGNIYYIANENTSADRYILNEKAKEIYKTKSKEITAEIARETLLIIASESNAKKNDLIHPKVGLIVENEIVNLKNNYIEVVKKQNYEYYTLEGKFITKIKK